MTEAQAYFEHLVARFTQEVGIAEGKMMSSPALKCKGKVFAFFHNESMTFKLGKDYRPEEEGIGQWNYLSPFKNKPPMKAWFSLPYAEKEHWERLARQAKENMK